MTNFLIKGVTLPLCVLLVLSCTDENFRKTEDSQVQIKNGILIFKTQAHYENLVHSDEETKIKFMKSLDERDDYISLKKKYLNEESILRESDQNARAIEALYIEEDDLLGSMLNEYGVVGIEDYYFKIDSNGELVFVLPSLYESEMEDLIDGEWGNENVYVFSTDDDVLYLLDEGIKGTVDLDNQVYFTGLFCSESGARGRKEANNEYNPAVWGYNYRQDNKVVYQKAGIYFSLQAKIKTQKKSLGIWWPYKSGLSIDYYVRYQAKCKSIQESFGITPSVFDNVHSKRPYESTRGLSSYYYSVRFKGLDFWSNVYKIED